MQDDRQLKQKARELANLLLAKELAIATAESCTGGWIAKVLTDIPGSSAWFGYGLVTYSNDAKMRLLGVAERTLTRHGAVSEKTVMEMAAGARQLSAADWAVAVSGVAGPSGGSPEKPVGLVCFGFAGRDGELDSETAQFDGDREAVRRQSVVFALSGLMRRIRSL